MPSLVNTSSHRDYSATLYTSITSAAFSLTAGNFSAVGYGLFYPTGGLLTPTVSDSAGNSYTFAASELNSNNGSQVGIFFCQNCLGSGSNTITLNFGSNQVRSWGVVTEQWTGIASSPLDAAAGGFGTGPNVVTGTYTTTNANELALATARAESIGQNWTAGTTPVTFTVDVQDPDGVQGMESAIYSTTYAGQTSFMTASVSGVALTIAFATFKLGSAPPPTPVEQWVQTRYHYEYRT